MGCHILMGHILSYTVCLCHIKKDARLYISLYKLTNFLLDSTNIKLSKQHYGQEMKHTISMLGKGVNLASKTTELEKETFTNMPLSPIARVGILWSSLTP